MGWFGKRNALGVEVAVCAKCQGLELLERQLRANLDMRDELIRRQDTTIEVLQNVIRDTRPVPVTDDGQAIALARATALMVPDDAEEPEEAVGDGDTLRNRIDEVHMDGWEPPEAGEPADIFTAPPETDND